MLTKPMTLVLLLVAAVVSGAAAQDSSAAVGCWAVSFSPWTPAIPEPDADLYRPLPDTVKLERIAVPERFAQGYLQGSRRPNRPPDLIKEHVDSLAALWRPLAEDSLELWLPVWWSTGIRARLLRRGDSFEGSAEVYVDEAGIPVPRAKVTGHRVPCARGA